MYKIFFAVFGICAIFLLESSGIVDNSAHANGSGITIPEYVQFVNQERELQGDVWEVSTPSRLYRVNGAWKGVILNLSQDSKNKSIVLEFTGNYSPWKIAEENYWKLEQNNTIYILRPLEVTSSTGASIYSYLSWGGEEEILYGMENIYAATEKVAF